MLTPEQIEGERMAYKAWAGFAFYDACWKAWLARAEIAGGVTTARGRLCYVSGGVAFFTTRALDKQWGDDWDDAPYEHNAGEPYLPHGDTDEAWEIHRLHFDGDFSEPRDRRGVRGNSPWSVQDINAGVTAWLVWGEYRREPSKPLHAGATVAEFIAYIQENGGTVYAPIRTEDRPQ